MIKWLQIFPIAVSAGFLNQQLYCSEEPDTLTGLQKTARGSRVYSYVLELPEGGSTQGSLWQPLQTIAILRLGLGQTWDCWWSSIWHVQNAGLYWQHW